MSDPTRIIRNALIETSITFSDILEVNNVPECTVYQSDELSTIEFDKINQQFWYIPVEYQNYDIATFVLDQCKTEEELQRAGKELLLYQERDMFVLLQYLKYLVDTMRNNNIVWGVGRGSSVASFVLYLIGVHKINSLYYDLPIEEFLK
jgi:DNA polymerase III alpha subunit